jgi:hypothetical protein
LKCNAETKPFPSTLREVLIETKKNLSAESLIIRNAKYGIKVAKTLNTFILEEPFSSFDFENRISVSNLCSSIKIKLLLTIKEREFGLVLWVYRYWTPHA